MAKVRRLNVQGLAVKSELLVGCIKADPGKLLISRDILAAEPLITSLLSGCPFYTYATFTGIGKKPFYQNGRLMISDLYLMFGSVNPLTKDRVKQLFDPEEWMRDPESVKTKLKSERKLNKLVCLASAYGVGKKTLQMHLLSEGFKVPLDKVAEILAEFWNLFSKIKQTINKFSRQFDKQGYLINLFGFRVIPRKSQDALNSLNQSSVTGLMNLYTKMIFEQNTGINQEFKTIIHDCLIVQVPEENVDKANQAAETVLEELNKELDWGLPVRVDYHCGKTFYDLK